MKKSLQDFVGKKVQIYPGDTHKKIGSIQEISDQGILFLITEYSGADNQYTVGKHYFISFSANLSFKEI